MFGVGERYMQRIKTLIICAFAMITFALTASSGTNSITIVNFRNDWQNNDLRKEMAQKLYQHFKSIKSLIAPLSTRQREFIEKEYLGYLHKNGNKIDKRVLDVMNTREYELYIVNNYLDNVLSLLDELLKASISIKQDTIHWALLSHELGSSIEYVGIIEKFSQSDKDLEAAVKKFSYGHYFPNLVIQSMTIQDKIILPYIENSNSN